MRHFIYNRNGCQCLCYFDQQHTTENNATTSTNPDYTHTNYNPKNSRVTYIFLKKKQKKRLLRWLWTGPSTVGRVRSGSRSNKPSQGPARFGWNRRTIQTGSSEPRISGGGVGVGTTARTCPLCSTPPLGPRGSAPSHRLVPSRARPTAEPLELTSARRWSGVDPGECACLTLLTHNQGHF